MNKQLLLLPLICSFLCTMQLSAQSFGCDGQFVNAGLYESLCNHPNGGFISLAGSASNNVLGYVWSDENGEIARDNLVVDNYFISETTTLSLSGIVISDNQIVDGEFGSGDDFENGFPSNYQGTFYTDYVRGPLQDFPPPPNGDDEPDPDRGDAGFVSPLGEDGSYMVTDDAFNGGFGFETCMDPDGFGNIAVFNLGADRNKIICTRVQLTAGNEYIFSAQVATVGEVTYQDFGGEPGDGPPGPGDASDPDGDVDGDGITNSRDNCPYVANPGQEDDDMNGLGDACEERGEADSDADGVSDDIDNCPFVANPSQDPAACSTGDRDGDGVLDWQDNCPEVANPGQEDRDGDGTGDACAEDTDPGGGGGLEGGEFGDYCIPWLELEIQGVNNQNTVIGGRHESELEFCVWTDMVRTFTAEVTGEVEICLMSTCNFAGGNLLALDNLQFSETCRISDEVTIHVDNITASILPVEPLDCNTEGVLLEGEWDAIYEDINSIEFFWFESSQQVLIDGATDEEYFVEETGSYNFSVFNEESGCFAVFELDVEDNFSTPEATIELPDTLSCKNESVILDASASSGGADDGTYTYEWNGVFGAEFAGGDPDPNSPIQEVVGSGTYELLITNTFNGCTSETFIFVEENLESVSLSTPQENFELGCETSSATFEATATIDDETDMSDIEFIWSLDSEIISTSSTFEPLEVGESGVYVLTVVNNSSGCSDELSFTVTGEVSGPVIAVPPVTETISCNNASVDISASIDDNPDVSYVWTNSNGDNISPNGELTLSVTEPGTYTFTAIDNISGCEASEQVEIVGDTDEPAFSIGIPIALDCVTSEVMLEGLPIDQMGNYSYQWTDESGLVLGDAITQEVTTAGMYTLQIIDLDNGCPREVRINVFDISAEPEVTISQDLVLNCNNSSSNISIDSNEDNLIFLWDTGDGNITTESGSSITVDQAGTYSVTITDEDNGCVTITELNLESDFTAPTFQATIPNDLNCDNIFSTLSIDDFGNDYDYAWVTQNGSISGGANSGNPVFDLAGEYTVTITNPISGCELEQTFTVVGNTLEPEIEVTGGGQLGCNDQNLPLNVNLLNSIPKFSVSWMSNNGGAFDSQTNTANVLASASGTYEVIVTNTDNGCTAARTIEITQDNNRPEVNLPQPLNLDCNNSTVTLDANGSDSGGNLQISWTAQNGSVISDPTSLSPSVSTPDTYTLTITNPDNGCETSATVTIDEFTAEPVVDLIASAAIDCENPSLTLGGSLSSTGPEFQYQWFDANQQAIPGATNPNLQVNDAGTYILNIINTTTGCENEATAIVTGDADLPEVNAGQPLQLDCNNTSAVLVGTASPNATYTWTTDDGNIVSGANTLQPEINAGGTYILTAFVQSTGCEASSTVVIEEDMSEPDVLISGPTELSCINETLIADGSQSSSGSEFQYQWFDASMQAIAGATNSILEVNETGTYILRIINTLTGCENESQVVITGNSELPEADAGQSLTLDCNVPSLNLSGTASANASYTWTTTGGNIISGANTLTPEINAPGTYTLTATLPGEGCEVVSTVVVEGDDNTPEIVVASSFEINCTNPELTIDASQSSSSGVDILWSSADNNPIIGETTLMPTISEPGIYILTITDSNSGCDNSTQIEVTENDAIPSLNLEEQIVLDCDQPNALIGDIDNPNFSYEWSSSTPIQGSSTDAQLEVSEAGIYELLVIDNTSGCQEIFSVDVSGDFDAAEILSIGADEINCTNQQVTAELDIDTDISEVSIIWTTLNGSIDSGASTLTPQFSQAGEYTVEITSIGSGCVSNETIVITDNFEEPVFELGQSLILDCEQSNATIGLGLNEQLPTYEYIWTDLSGTVVSNDARIDVDMEGVFMLEVLNTTNGCTYTDQIGIEENIDMPEVSVVESATFLCDDNEIQLSGSLISSISNFTIRWETENGRIVNGEDTFEPSISQPGTYTMIITNLDTQCEALADVIVDNDMDAPDAIIEPVGDLTCNVSSLVLNGSNSSGNGNLEFTWYKDGDIFATNTDQITISEPGEYDLEVLDLNNTCSTRTTAFIELDNQDPEVVITMPLILDCDRTEVVLETEFDSDNDLSFVWTSDSSTGIISGVDTPNPVVNQSGNYSAIVTDLNTGCSTTIGVMVEQDASLPQFDLASDGNLTCDNLSVNLSADVTNGNFDFIWTNLSTGQVANSTNQELIISEPGTYQLEVLDAQSTCSSTKTIEVTQSIVEPDLEIIQPLGITCDNLNTQINAQILNNDSNYDITWSTIDGEIGSANLNSLDIDVLSGGTYTIEVLNLDNGCFNSLDILVEENGESPEFEFEDVSQVDCTNPEVEVSVTTTSSISNQSILWTTTDGNILGDSDTEEILVNQGGTYTVIIENLDNGCTNEQSVVVEFDKNDPVLNATEAAELNCTVLQSDLTVTVSDATNFDITWSTSNGNIVGALNEVNTVVNVPGEYNAIITNLDNGCTSEITIPVSQNIDIPSVEVDEAELLTCRNEVVSLQGAGPSNLNIDVLWTDLNGGIISNNQSEMVEVNLPGTYTFTVTNLDNNCVNDAEVVVQRNMNEPTDFTPVVSEPLCFGDLGSVNIVEVDGGVGPFNYSIDGSPFDPTSDFDQLTPGSYSIAVMDSEECVYEENVIVPATPQLLVSTSPDVELLVGLQNQINVNASIPDSEIASVSWSPATYLSCDDCLNPTVTPLNDIEYTVTIENENGCIATDVISFKVQRIVGVYTPDAFSPNGDGINDTFTIYSKEDIIDRISELSIYDRWGNQVYNMEDFPVNEEQFGWDGSFRNEALQPDVYIYKALIVLANGEVEELKGNVSLIK